MKYIILHHSAVSYVDVPKQFSIINNYHKSKGWGMIGYHYLIEKSGKLLQGRKEDQVGAHCIGRNHDSLGICLAGNFDTQIPTNAQQLTLENLLERLEKDYPEAKVKYHRDFANTHCPGLLIDDYYKSNNKKMKLIMDSRNNKQFLLGNDNKIRWIFNEVMLNELHDAGVVDKNEVEIRDDVDTFVLANPWAPLAN